MDKVYLIVCVYIRIRKFPYKIYILFLKEVSPRLHLFDKKYSKNSHIVKYYYNLK